MWWSETVIGRRGVLGLLPVLALAGCGFAPALGDNGAAQRFMGRVRAADPVDEAGFAFVRQIEARLGRASVVEYDLAHSITTSSEGVAITPDGAITRYNVSGVARWTLTRRLDGVRVAGGSVDTFTSYSATGSTVAGLAAREDAGRRLMTLLADAVVTRMLAA